MQELMAMQESGPRNIGFFGTRNMGFMHQNLIEVLSYAMVLTVSLSDWTQIFLSTWSDESGNLLVSSCVSSHKTLSKGKPRSWHPSVRPKPIIPCRNPVGKLTSMLKPCHS